MKTWVKQIKQKINNVAGRKWARRGLLVYAALFPFVLFFALERLNPTSAAGLMARPLESWGIILLSAVFIACAALALFALIGSVLWAFTAVSAFLTAAYVVNNIKLMVTGFVFVPTDLMIAGEAFTMAGEGGIIIERALVLGVILIALLHLPLIFVKWRLPFKRRLVGLFVALLAFFPVFGLDFSASRILNALDVDTSGSLTNLYMDVGFIVGFHAALIGQNARNLGIADAELAVLDFFANARPDNGRMDDMRPNVIVIMSEAFMDPTVIPNLEFSADPVANFRRLRKTGGGDVVVPVFGGRTANTEFEFLTGSSMFFMGSAYYVPYNNTGLYFYRDVTTALPWLFRANGYRTVAVHPYSRYFFSRDQVYPRLGFEKFIGYEDMEDPQYKGFFVSDEFFTDQIIEQIILAEEDNTPLFLFGISMQNHWEFDPDKYDGWSQDIYATSQYLDEFDLGIVNSYLQGIFDADKQLGRLVEFIESRETPTILVFFGDHLPILGNQTESVFYRLGYVSDSRAWLWNREDVVRMYTLPFLVWSNFGEENKDWGILSTYFLAANVLAHSGINLSPYWHYILYLNEFFRALTEIHYVDIQGNFHLQRLLALQEKPYIQAMEALHQIKWFGTAEFRRILSEIIIN